MVETAFFMGKCVQETEKANVMILHSSHSFYRVYQLDHSRVVRNVRASVARFIIIMSSSCTLLEK